MSTEYQPNAVVIARLKELFDKVDEDKSGEIYYPEMVKMMKEMNLKNPEFFTVLLWYICNKSEDNSMKLDEFKLLMLNLPKIEKFPQLISDMVFAKLDADESGTVEVEELYKLFKDLNHICSFEHVKLIFQDFDKDNNGSLDRREFRKFIATISRT